MQFQAVIAQQQCWDTPRKSGREGFGRKPPASGWAPGTLQATNSRGLATRSPGLNVWNRAPGLSGGLLEWYPQLPARATRGVGGIPGKTVRCEALSTGSRFTFASRAPFGFPSSNNYGPVHLAPPLLPCPSYPAPCSSFGLRTASPPPRGATCWDALLGIIFFPVLKESTSLAAASSWTLRPSTNARNEYSMQKMLTFDPDTSLQ